MSSVRVFFSAFLVLSTLAGCQSTQQMLASDEDMATQAALRRGQFELDCPSATASILSSNMLQPVLWRGVERAEYTVGISGCGKRTTYVVICPMDTSTCFAGAAHDAPEVTQ